MLRLPAGRTKDLLVSLEKEDLSSLPWLTHTVERRETLSKIARGYGVAMADIASVNPIPDMHFLSIGQKLIIPLEPDARRSETRISDPPRDKSMEASKPANSRAHLHKVGVGETLSSISRRYRVSEKDLRRWNSDLEEPLRPSQPMLVFLPERRPEVSLAMKVPSS
jgi:LysM repeat protein